MLPKNSLPKSTLQTLAEQAHALCGPLERGQANRPLTQALQSFLETGEGPLVISILCLDAAAGQAVAAQCDPIACGDRNTAFRIAQCATLQADIAAYQNFCRGAHALLIAGGADSHLDGPQSELIRNLGELFLIVWPIVFPVDQPDADQPAVNQPAVNQPAVNQPAVNQPAVNQPDVDQLVGDRPVAGWWDAVRSAAGLGGEAATERAACAGASQWTERLQLLREPLLLQNRSSALAVLLEQLSARTAHELAYLTQAQSRLEVPVKNSLARSTADSDKELAPLRERLAEQYAAIDRQLTLKSDRSTQPLGELSAMMRSVCTSIDIEDLDKTRTPALLKLSINASHLARINRRIEHALRQEFVSDLQEVQRQMRGATDQLLGTLCERVGAGVQIKLPSLDVNQAWRSVENLMAIGKETHIELPRRGFFDVLTAGRQKVFIIIMFASLMGRMGLPNLFSTPAAKTAFGLFMAAVMIGSMISAILHWRREKQLTSEKELSKIRDSLLTEGSKTIDQVERVKLTTMREFLKEATRTFECTAKQSIEETLAEQRAKRESEYQRQESLRKSVDSRLKLAAETQRSVAKLVEQARGLSAAAQRSLHEAVARLQGSNKSPLAGALTVPVSAPAVPSGTLTAPESAFEVGCAASTPAARPPRPARTTLAASRPAASGALAQRRQQRELALGKTGEK